MDLPVEIREKIINKIDQNKIIEVRRVCKSWNKDVNDWFVFDIQRLDDNLPNFSSVLLLRINKLKIFRLLKTPVPENDCILKFPELINDLQIRTVLTPQGTVSPEHVQMLLNACTANLKTLTLQLTPLICNHQFIDEVNNVYKKLSSIVIEYVGTNSENINLVKKSKRTIFGHFIHCSMPCLKKLSVRITGSEMSNISKAYHLVQLLKFVGKNGLNLEDLIMDFGNLSNADTDMTLNGQDLTLLGRINKLKTAVVCFKPFGILSRTYWQEWIIKQNQLDDLNLTYNSPTSPTTAQFCRQLLLNNFVTLKRLCISDLITPIAEPPFDLSIFESCYNLQELSLAMHRNQTKNHQQIEVVNFQRLSMNIQNLSIVNIKLLSHEIDAAFSDRIIFGTKGFKKLKTLTLRSCGERDRFGITGDSIYKILTYDRPLFVSADLRYSVNFSISGTVISMILKLGLSVVKDGNNFRLERNLEHRQKALAAYGWRWMYNC